ncbi:glycosyltransferase [bacterium]|nr:glycosyltransferase [bacterium]
MNYSNLKIGYVPLKSDLITAPGDYRRFVNYAKIRGIDYEVAALDRVYDVVVITQGADITLWRDYKHGIIIYDLIDSYLSISRFNLKALLRGLAKYVAGRHIKLEFNYWNSIRKMCIRSDIVICSTKEQRDKILPYCSKVPIILDYHDEVVKNPKKNYRLNDKVKLVWEGMPSNLYQLKLIKKPLLKLSQKYNIELHIVTSHTYYKFLGKYGLTQTQKEVDKIFNNTIVHEWTKETISDVVRQCDIAIIPIDSNYFLTKFKPENKILFFWKMGVPVVASNIPSYARTMNNANLDFICKDEISWEKKIESLILSCSMRHSAAIAGKEYAEKIFSTGQITKKWDDVFKVVEHLSISNV